jgi:hypothetical protein
MEQVPEYVKHVLQIAQFAQILLFVVNVNPIISFIIIHVWTIVSLHYCGPMKQASQMEQEDALIVVQYLIV